MANRPAIQPMIKVRGTLWFTSQSFYSRGLDNFAVQIANESIPGQQIEFIEIEPLPFINMDLEVNGTYPPVVEAFRQKILEADSILFASPEYNYSLSPPLKNAIDRASGPPNCWADKPTTIIKRRGGFMGTITIPFTPRHLL
ncbi:hypothetical protein IFM89_011618 [Coptis chinensis]|uniref:NAD(P)H dehydrogenase (quinone) n=1 Tax=Coptis chinensis TaxID=261450 RepID=A0A835H4G3_9MAGN|nr:hypothetical protein IFM89_011618 [Coptis chinensis]